MPHVLPTCLFRAYDVCRVLCVFAFCFSSFTFSSDFKQRSVIFLREVFSGAGAVRGDGVNPLRAYSIRGVATSTVFMQTGRSLRCWKPHLGGRIQFLLRFSCAMYSSFSKGCIPMVPSFWLGPSLILLSFFSFGWWGAGVVPFWGGMRSFGALRV